jgi:hypothetical protein
MNVIQLEFNIKNESDDELKFSLMQKQINDMHESMGKVRRKLFSEMGEVKKLYQELKVENERLRMKLKEINNEKTEWIYTTEDSLFDVRERQEACG